MNTGGVFTKILSLFGRRPVALADFLELQESRMQLSNYRKVSQIAEEGAPSKLISYLLKNLEISKSQQMQDLLAIYFSGESAGYFVEFGATDGIDLSNTYILEKKYGWQGILAEPARIWSSDLILNRKAHISLKCVYSESNLSVDFLETESTKLSSMLRYAFDDQHFHERASGKTYTVTTVSLNELLCEYEAPIFIEFLSIDTEGSEFSILQAFDFSSRTFGFISVEHNFTENNQKIEELLRRFDYLRILPISSEFDGWYLHRSIYEKLWG